MDLLIIQIFLFFQRVLMKATGFNEGNGLKPDATQTKPVFTG